MHEVGYSLYLEMLEKAVQDLKSGKEPSLTDIHATQTEVELNISCIITEDLIPDTHLRLQFYKRISMAKDSNELDNIQAEMIDRFGSLPWETNSLFHIAEIKLKAISIGITKIKANSSYVKIEFGENTTVGPEVIIKLIQTKPNTYQLLQPSTLKITLPDHEPSDRHRLVMTYLNDIQV